MPSRADAYAAFYRRSRFRLLHQTYAYCGSTEIARHSLSDAYVAAAHHWRKLGALSGVDQEAWIRQRAFRATTKPQPRSSQPWYVSARSTSEEHRPLINALLSMTQTERHLVIVRCLAGLSPFAAGREAGVTDVVAQRSLEHALRQLAEAGVAPGEPAVTAALQRLSADLHDEPADRASRLRREGDWRRRSHLLLAGVTTLAVAIGAGAVTAAQSEPLVEPASPIDVTPSQTPSSTPTTAPVVEDPFSTASLLSGSDLEVLDPSRPWAVVTTSLDFGIGRPLDDCYAADPAEHAKHHWTRRFTSGSGDSPNQAVEVLEVAASTRTARTAYARAVSAFTTCPAGSRQVVEVSKARGLGDGATFVSLRYVDGAQVRNEMVAVARTGVAVVTWLVRFTPAHPVQPRSLVRTASTSVNSVCKGGEGRCASLPFDLVDRKPPPPRSGRGFLATVDLPRFPEVAAPWVATKVESVNDNPSATICDRADFAAAGADPVRSRSYVIPGARHLPDIFGLTETVGAFTSSAAARAFTAGVEGVVAACSDRQPNVTVRVSDDVSVGQVHGRLWQIDAATSQDKVFVFRVLLLRRGSTVTQVTFTPTVKLDIRPEAYADLATRAAQRLSQL